LGGSSYKQITASAVWRIATPIGAEAIHPISFELILLKNNVLLAQKVAI